MRGGAVRVYLDGEAGTRYTVKIEPRFDDLETRNIWISCNQHMITNTLLPEEALKAILERGYEVAELIATRFSQ